MNIETSRRLLSVLLILIFFASCQNHKHRRASPSGFTDETFIEELKKILPPADSTVGKKGIMPVTVALRYTYQLDEYQPIWLKDSFRSNAAAAKLIAELEDVRWDGLNPEHYNLEVIKNLKIKLDTTRVNNITDAITFDTLLTHSYLAASHDLLLGEISPKKADSLWYHTNDTVWNAPSFLADSTGTYHSLADYRSAVPTYALLRDEYKRYYELGNDSEFGKAVSSVRPVKHKDSAGLEHINTVIKTEMPWVQTTPNDSVSEEAQLISAYQAYMGLKQTGKPDSSTIARLQMPVDSLLVKLRANMERVRWMQKEFGKLYLIVDVPLMELFLRKDGDNLMHMRVVVGRPERQTPSLYARMANIIINPSWGVPPTILKNDVLPGLQKSGKKYLSKKGLKAYDKDGDVVDPSFINANNYKQYTYKQAPGDDNSLGYVKFNLPNHWDIYLHDTPHRDDFAKRDRFLSSGCIRLQQPKEMAVFILSQFEKRRYTEERLDSVIATHKTRWEELRNRIPVHITYLTAFDDTTGKHIQFVRDIYNRDDKLISLLH